MGCERANFEFINPRTRIFQIASLGKLAVSGHFEASSLRPLINQVSSIVRVLTVSCLLLTVWSGHWVLPPNSVNQSLSPSRMALSCFMPIAWLHSSLPLLMLSTRKPCCPSRFKSDDPPWLERVNPDINWIKRTLTYRHLVTAPSIPGGPRYAAVGSTEFSESGRCRPGLVSPKPPAAEKEHIIECTTLKAA